jgi:hypothetical protein
MDYEKGNNKMTIKFTRSNLAIATLLCAGTLVCSHAAAQQQLGGIKGKLTFSLGHDHQDHVAAGISITAISNVMPKTRTAISKADGSFALPLLIPGRYQLRFKLANGAEQAIYTEVFLDQTSMVNFSLAANDTTNTETIAVIGSSIVRQGNSSLTNSINDTVVKAVPVGQGYRDLMKLIPGVQYSENVVQGPSAGGSGSDNKYGFDGADISLPMFGNLSSEPSVHDIQSVSMDRGGAKAIGFNRSGGFTINSTSKSGTNEFHANIEYKLQNKSFVADQRGGKQYELNKSWLTTSISGPIIEDGLFFYGSYYNPQADKFNSRTAYGEVKDFDSDRNEYFAKFTGAPTDNLLFNLSARSSKRSESGVAVGEFSADSTSLGGELEQDIKTFDASWLINDDSSLSFGFTTFELNSQSLPATLFTKVTPTVNGNLDLTALDQQGAFWVPEPKQQPMTEADIAFNLGAQPLIDRYGYSNDAGIATGGGTVGGNSTLSNHNFKRDSFQISFKHEFAVGNSYHYLHLGYKKTESSEQLSRMSNGWGAISYVGGIESANDGTPIFYRTKTEQMSFQDDVGNAVPAIHSSVKNQDIEINDTIEQGDFTYNVGLLLSKDNLYGQGLREKDGTLSGFELAPGNPYKMYTTHFKDLLQPRLGLTWHYNANDTVFANFAVYNPSASSLARAASWARNMRKTINVDFDQNGQMIQATPAPGSSGKFFADNLTPRRIDEFTIGTGKLMSQSLYLRAHVRYREGSHFWEDMPNGARNSGDYGPNGGVPDNLAELGDYIPNLADIRNEIGGSSYVIAEVDSGYTKYWEANFEAQWQGKQTYLNFSYVWSRYHGNFDQDNTSSVNDANTFIGSSNYGDGKGRYVWDYKNGTLRGDRPHIVKAYGYYTTGWQGNIGAYFIFQSGQPWEKWDGSIYGYSNSTNRYAEPAGSRRSASHWQIDLSYSQSFTFLEQYTMALRADLFNLLNRQTGYNHNPYANTSTFGEARSFYNPQRLQLSVNLGF